MANALHLSIHRLREEVIDRPLDQRGDRGRYVGEDLKGNSVKSFSFNVVCYPFYKLLIFLHLFFRLCG